MDFSWNKVITDVFLTECVCYAIMTRIQCLEIKHNTTTKMVAKQNNLQTHCRCLLVTFHSDLSLWLAVVDLLIRF
jgi:hypothetical protein